MPDLAAYGHHFLIGLQPSPVLTDHDKRLLARIRPLGIILFRDNFRHDATYDDWLDSLKRLIGDARDCCRRDRLVVAIDHEGGRVVRPPRPITPFGYARNWHDRAGDVGRAMAIELKALGVNLCFGPVVDIDSNPDNPVIGPRAFGRDPATVIASGRAFRDALHAEGIVACPKHFPGHGDTAIDSHLALPVLDLDEAQLWDRELAPFAALNDGRTEMMMTAHVLLPRLDPRSPATFSRPILRLLRERIGFGGVVVSDDLGMGAITRSFADETVAVESLTAGSDIFVLCAYQADTNRALALAGALDQARRRGDLSSRLLERSAERISRLIGRLRDHRPRRLGADVFADHRDLAPLHDDGLPKGATSVA